MSFDNNVSRTYISQRYSFQEILSEIELSSFLFERLTNFKFFETNVAKSKHISIGKYKELTWKNFPQISPQRFQQYQFLENVEVHQFKENTE